MRKFSKTAFIVIFCAALFAFSSYLYLSYSLKQSKKAADRKAEDVPYFNPPENCGVLLGLPSERSVLFFLDFEKEILYIIDVNTHFSESEAYVGYPVDFKCKADYYTLSLFLDRIGGVDFETEEGFCRLNGIQICDMIKTENSDEMRFNLVCAFCERVSQTGLTADDFVFLTDNCDTDLTMPVCLYWCDYMKGMFANPVFVNRDN